MGGRGERSSIGRMEAKDEGKASESKGDSESDEDGFWPKQDAKAADDDRAARASSPKEHQVLSPETVDGSESACLEDVVFEDKESDELRGTADRRSPSRSKSRTLSLSSAFATAKSRVLSRGSSADDEDKAKRKIEALVAVLKETKGSGSKTLKAASGAGGLAALSARTSVWRCSLKFFWYLSSTSRSLASFLAKVRATRFDLW